MRSVTNIQKITKAMKMVAASKMRVAQVNTERSRGLTAPFLKLLGDLPGALVCALVL
jgi:F-type H+-transporting ATPase subunit gamma